MMIFKEIKTTTDEVLEFIRDAGIEIVPEPEAKTLHRQLLDGNVEEMPPDFNIFDEPPFFAETRSLAYTVDNISDSNAPYILGKVTLGFDNYVDPNIRITAA